MKINFRFIHVIVVYLIRFKGEALAYFLPLPSGEGAGGGVYKI